MPLRAKQKYNLSAEPLKVMRTLNVPFIKQEQTNWCWAACAEMVLEYYGNSSSDQCDFANWAFGGATCCTLPSSSLCDKPVKDKKITDLYDHYNLKSSYVSADVPFGALVVEIEGSRPIEVGFTFSGNKTGHVALVVGTDVINGKQVVRVNDPAEQASGGVLYSDLTTAYGLGDWDATWTGIQKQ